MTNPYKLESHRLAFDQAVQLIQSGIDDRFEVARQLDQAIPREMRKKIAAKACRLLGHYAKSPPGTPPNTSVILTDDELSFINHCYGGQKSRAIHDGLILLIKSTKC